ncbi:MAG: hypothetical protein AAFX09_02600 [Pseudomonadota bacterium]
MKKKTPYGQLALLKRGGTTSRVIDLVSIHDRFGATADYAEKPLFRTARLNRSFIVKHALRGWERDRLGVSKCTVTKIIFPMSDRDLNMGGQSLFVEEPGSERMLAEFLGVAITDARFEADYERLKLLSDLPSFDPYLLREFFQRRGDVIARCYFQLSDAEFDEVTNFVAGQIDRLVQRAMGSGGDMSQSLKLARILFEDEESKQLEFLRHALRMTPDEYRAGVFGWKGTLYYYWSCDAWYAQLQGFMAALRGLKIVGAAPGDRVEIDDMIYAVLEGASARWGRIKSRLASYDEEFSRFVNNGDPAALKAFLHRAPGMFLEMGEDIGSLQHLLSYWRFWTDGQPKKQMTASDALEILPDFEAAVRLHRDEAA